MVWSVSIDGSTRDIIRMTFQTGSQRNANPQRPTGAWGSGRLAIHGYRTQTRKRLQIVVGGTDRVDAWIQNERYDDKTDISTYDIRGLLGVPARARSMVTQGAANADANQTTVINKMRDAFGVSAIQSSLASTPLSLYSFEGPAGGYASRFGLVSGGLPYATQKGLLGIKDPTRVPTTLDGTVGSRTHRIRDIVSTFDSDQLWNVLSTSYPSVLDGMSPSTVDPQSTITGGTGPNGLPMGAPFSSTDILYMNHVAEGQSGATTQYPVSLQFTPPQNRRVVNGRFRVRVLQYRLRVTLTDHSPADDAVEAGLWDTYITGTVQNDGTLTASIADRFDNPFPDGRLNNNWAALQHVYYRVTAEYKIEVPDSAPVMVGNDASIAAWDARTLEVPGWIQRTATSTLQSRINALASVRNLRTVDLYLDQRDTTKTNAVAAIEPGHYIALSDVGTIVYVMNVDWRLSSRQSAIKRLTCIDTGTDHTPTVPTDALTWRSDEVTWRSQYLEWSRA